MKLTHAFNHYIWNQWYNHHLNTIPKQDLPKALPEIIKSKAKPLPMVTFRVMTKRFDVPSKYGSSLATFVFRKCGVHNVLYVYIFYLYIVSLPKAYCANESMSAFICVHEVSSEQTILVMQCTPNLVHTDRTLSRITQHCKVVVTKTLIVLSVWVCQFVSHS